MTTHDDCRTATRNPYSPTGSGDLNRVLIRKRAIAALRAGDALHVVPTPLEDIRIALQLTSSSELEAMQEMPRELRRLIAKLGRRVRGALDTRERIVYVDPNLRQSQARFVLGHEIGHDALPWQSAAHQIDTDETLTPSVRDRFEREANYFSSELLFNIDQLHYMAAGAPLSLTTPIGLHQTFGSSLVATVRRYVEEHSASCALLVLGRHPTRSMGHPATRMLYGIESPKFAERFGPVMRGLRLPPAWPHNLHPLAAACFDAVTATGRPLERGRFSAATGDDFSFEVYGARPYPFVLLTPRHPLRRVPRTRVEWPNGAAAQDPPANADAGTADTGGRRVA